MATNFARVLDEALLLSSDTGTIKQIKGEQNFGGLPNDVISWHNYDEDCFLLNGSNGIICNSDYVYSFPTRVSKVNVGPVSIGENGVYMRCILLNENSYYNKGEFSIPMRITVYNQDTEKQEVRIVMIVSVNCDNHLPRNIDYPPLKNTSQYGIYIGKTLTKTCDSTGFCIGTYSPKKITIEAFPPNGLTNSKLIAWDTSQWFLI